MFSGIYKCSSGNCSMHSASQVYLLWLVLRQNNWHQLGGSDRCPDIRLLWLCLHLIWMIPWLQDHASENFLYNCLNKLIICIFYILHHFTHLSVYTPLTMKHSFLSTLPQSDKRNCKKRDSNVKQISLWNLMCASEKLWNWFDVIGLRKPPTSWTCYRQMQMLSELCSNFCHELSARQQRNQTSMFSKDEIISVAEKLSSAGVKRDYKSYTIISDAYLSATNVPTDSMAEKQTLDSLEPKSFPLVSLKGKCSELTERKDKLLIVVWLRILPVTEFNLTLNKNKLWT